MVCSISGSVLLMAAVVDPPVITHHTHSTTQDQRLARQTTLRCRGLGSCEGFCRYIGTWILGLSIYLHGYVSVLVEKAISISLGGHTPESGICVSPFVMTEPVASKRIANIMLIRVFTMYKSTMEGWCLSVTQLAVESIRGDGSRLRQMLRFAERIRRELGGGNCSDLSSELQHTYPCKTASPET